jgi:hypothetical protein
MFCRPLASSGLTTRRRNLAGSTQVRLAVLALEERSVPAALSIGDASAAEGGTAMKFLDRFVPDGSGGNTRSRSLTFGPDGNHDGAPDLYDVDVNANAILRYDGVTGTFLDVFVPSGSGDLNSPTDPTFGPDGSLYVASSGTNQVLRYDGSTGAFLGAVVGGLNSPQGLTFGGDGSLYIADSGTNEVLRYRNSVLSAFVPAGSGGLSQPRKALFGPDGNLYVASQGNGQVLRYSGQSGAFLGVFAATTFAQGPCWLGFGSDGYLYAPGRYSSGSLDMTYVRFNAATGAYVDNFPLSRDGWSFIVGPQGVLYVGGNGAGGFVDRFGASSLAAFAVSLDSPSASPVTVNFATADGTAKAGSDYVATSGTLTFAPGETSKTILVQTIDDNLSEPTETFFVNLSNAVGATITHGQGMGTITDNDPLQVSSAKVNGGAVQRSRVTDITVAFTGLATLPANPADAFRLIRLGPGSPTADVTLAVDPSASTATQTIVRLSFSGGLTEFGSLTDGEYRLTILSAQVSGAGQPLDGDGNGSPGGDFTLDLFRLFGDVNGDKAVDGLDLTAFRNAFGTTAADANYLSYLDFNGDGAIDGADLTQFRNLFGVILP